MSELKGYKFPVGWIVVTNGGSEPIPSFAVVKITSISASTAIPVVGQVDAADEAAVFFNGPAPIPPNEDGQVHCTIPCIAAYQADDGADPAHGGIWGTKSGSWYLHPNQKGFRILGAGAYGLCNVIRDLPPYRDFPILSQLPGTPPAESMFGHVINAPGVINVYRKAGLGVAWSTDSPSSDVGLIGLPAGVSDQGDVTASAQTFGGLKTFYDGVKVSQGTTDHVDIAYNSFSVTAGGVTRAGVPVPIPTNTADLWLLKSISAAISWDKAEDIELAIGKYFPNAVGDWSGSPASLKIREALDRCAALLKVLNGGTGP